MPNDMLAHPGALDADAIIADYRQRMAPTEADAFLNVRSGTVSAAIRRGEIEPYRFAGATRTCYVTPAILAEWLATHCRGKAPEGVA